MRKLVKPKKRTLNQLLKLIERNIKKIFNDENSGHDIYHLIRVKNLALIIQRTEGGDCKIIAISALLHDVHRILAKKSGGFFPPEKSLPMVRKILKGYGISKSELARIEQVIKHHEEYSFSKTEKTANDIESLIVQDADNLDAIGAIGIARAFAYGGANNIPIWVPEVKKIRKYFDESGWDVSEIHHFYSKLLKLRDNMNTKTGKKMARLRHYFMQKYLQQFFAEWKGEK